MRKRDRDGNASSSSPPHTSSSHTSKHKDKNKTHGKKKEEGGDGTEAEQPIHTQESSPLCPICLTACTHPTSLDGCIHLYCWECILEWSKVTNRCPSCKSSFRVLTEQKVTALNPKLPRALSVREKEQQQEHEFNSADWASDSDDDGLLDDEAMEGDTDDSNLSDSEIERQKERIRSMRGDLFNEHERFPGMDFGSDSEDSETKRSRRIERERAAYSSDEAELRDIMQLEEYDSDDGFVVDDDDSVELEDDESENELASFERDELESSSDESSIKVSQTRFTGPKSSPLPVIVSSGRLRRRGIVSSSSGSSDEKDIQPSPVPSARSTPIQSAKFNKPPPVRRHRVIEEDDEEEEAVSPAAPAIVRISVLDSDDDSPPNDSSAPIALESASDIGNKGDMSERKKKKKNKKRGNKKKNRKRKPQAAEIGSQSSHKRRKLE